LKNTSYIFLTRTCTQTFDMSGKMKEAARNVIFIYLLTEHLHLQCNITAGQQGTNK